MRAYEIHDLSQYLIAPAEEYYAWLVQSKEIGKHPELGIVVPAQRALIPLPESCPVRESRKILHKGKDVSPHAHLEWVALFYIYLGDPPLPVVINGESVQPHPGDCVVIPPGVRHHTDVSKSSRPRILTALLVEPQDRNFK